MTKKKFKLENYPLAAKAMQAFKQSARYRKNKSFYADEITTRLRAAELIDECVKGSQLEKEALIACTVMGMGLPRDVFKMPSKLATAYNPQIEKTAKDCFNKAATRPNKAIIDLASIIAVNESKTATIAQGNGGDFTLIKGLLEQSHKNEYLPLLAASEQPKLNDLYRQNHAKLMEAVAKRQKQFTP